MANALSVLDANSGELVDLGRKIVTGPDLQLGTVGSIATRIVQTEAGLRIEEGAIGLGHPLLPADAIAVPQLNSGPRSGAVTDDVQALAQRL